jgi:hypothetical protein
VGLSGFAQVYVSGSKLTAELIGPLHRGSTFAP